jgi:hypothetical protein
MDIYEPASEKFPAGWATLPGTEIVDEWLDAGDERRRYYVVGLSCNNLFIA